MFAKYFYFSWKQIVLWLTVTVIFFSLAFNPQGQFLLEDFLSIIIVLGVIPVYLSRRRRFVREFMSAFPEARVSSDVAMSNALAIILFWFMSLVIFSAFVEQIAQAIFQTHSTSLLELLLTAVFSFGMLLVLIYQTTRRTSTRTFWQNVSWTSGNQSWLRMVFVPVLLGILFACLSSYVIWARDVQPPTPLSNVLDETHSSLALGLFVIMALLIAPLLEELVFRGYFFNVLAQFKGKRLAIYVVSLSFAFLHVGQYWGDWLAIGMVTVLGFVLTFVRVWSQTTIASSIMHYCYNIGVTLIPLVAMMTSNPAFFEYQVHYATYDTPKKIELLKESIRYQPDLAEAYNDLAWLYAEQNMNLEEALELSDHALRLSPQQYSFLDTKAEVLTKLGRWQKSLEIRRQLLRQNTEDSYQQGKVAELEKFLNPK
jgi:membrane protease YdiL (CAAX protease family)